MLKNFANYFPDLICINVILTTSIYSTIGILCGSDYQNNVFHVMHGVAAERVLSLYRVPHPTPDQNPGKLAIHK